MNTRSSSTKLLSFMFGALLLLAFGVAVIARGNRMGDLYLKDGRTIKGSFAEKLLSLNSDSDEKGTSYWIVSSNSLTSIARASLDQPKPQPVARFIIKTEPSRLIFAKISTAMLQTPGAESAILTKLRSDYDNTCGWRRLSGKRVSVLITHASAQQNKLAPWQTDWKLYVAELGKDLQKGIDPGDDARIKGKAVELEGTLRKAFDPAKPDETLDIEMDDVQEITVMLKLFPMVDADKAGDKTGTVKLKKIMLKPAEASRDAWKAIANGSRVRFRGTVGNDAAVLVTTSDIGGLVFLFLQSGEVLPAK